MAAITSATADRLANAGLQPTVAVHDGDAAASIVKEASETGADLVVLGSRGLTGLSRLVLGSVARNVLIHAPCSVLIVRRHTYDVKRAAAATTPKATAV